KIIEKESSTIKARLLNLKELKNKGLITEDEYNKKRQEILNEL
ncbi:MAG: SPFH domain-containing protein, partial [Candidatus Lokiarchaeota archaeon]|nr:SPFH domain-containing protein [Candidatus Lokiarchaeota archaeon]